ncbi:autotransporter domain-containing protein [Cupriavidus sp. MP-37]|uniref:autotransporter outer membrane beta-barrel domain-containing protein n=1 Tax=Cupriavidus sp. MP-37 TaxID=2884455 RepID=UPI001D0B0676|nr:autotransporter domain-containing protein [Cupriavidus sp. MP-37]UDM48870.1 autotransporter domain-containing protein [Cupriavidus sp. MP-37]
MTHNASRLAPPLRAGLTVLAGTLPVLATSVMAQQVTWTGTAGSNIFDSANWSSGQVPGYQDAVLINGAGQAPRWDTSIQSGWGIAQFLLGSGINTSAQFSTVFSPDVYSARFDVYDPNTGNYAEAGVGVNGGNGQWNIDFRSQPQANLDATVSALNVGVGAGSTGRLNLLGTGKSSQSNNYRAGLGMTAGNLVAGASGNASAEINVDGAGLGVLRGSMLVGQGGTGTVNVLSRGKIAAALDGRVDRAPLQNLAGSNGGTGTINVLSGGKLAFPPAGLSAGKAPAILPTWIGSSGGQGTVTVSDAGSQATFGNGLVLGQGSGSVGNLNILAGGKVLSSVIVGMDENGNQFARPGVMQLGVDGGTGNVTVSGAGSRWNIAGSVTQSDDPQYDGIGELHVGAGGTGNVVIGDGGVVSLGRGKSSLPSPYALTPFVGGLGYLYLADSAASRGRLTIGAPVGSTPVAPGQLEAAGVIFGAGDGAIVFNHADQNYQFGIPLQGRGTIENHAGTTWLTADNSAFSGSTNLSGGTLGLARNASIGQSQVNVLANAGLAYADAVSAANPVDIRADATLAAVVSAGTATQGGAISGSGALDKQGGGTLNLAAANSFTGPAVVSGGTLALVGAGSVAQAQRVVADATFDVSAASGAANIRSLAGRGMVNIGAGSLNLTSAGDIYSGVLAGTGAFSLLAGTEWLSGDSGGFAGRTAVNGGTLYVTGTLGGPIDVAAGGTLRGTGTVGPTTIRAGGAIAAGTPDQRIATLASRGNLNFEPGAGYVDVDLAATSVGGLLQAHRGRGRRVATPVTQLLPSDLLSATGSATLNGATVRLAGINGGVFVPGSEWRILAASGGVTGTFGELVQNLPFVTLAYRYDANDAYLTVVRKPDVSFCQPGMTSNQCNTAGGVESLGMGSILAVELASQLSRGDAAHALDLLSGEQYASARSVMLEDSRFLREAINHRLRQARQAHRDGVEAESGDDGERGESGEGGVQASDRGAWIQVFGSWGGISGNGNAASVDRNLGGFFIGADQPLASDWRVGAMAGYSRSDFKVKDRNSSGNSDNYHLGLYAGKQWHEVSLRTGAGYTWHELSSYRTVAFPGLYDQTTADYSGSTAQVFGEISYQAKAGPVALEPFLNLAYVHLHTGSFSERGTIAELAGASSNADVGFSTLGLRASHGFVLRNGTRLSATGMLGWRYAMGDVGQAATLSFLGGDPFTVYGVPIARNAAVIEAGLKSALSPNLDVGLTYSGQYGGGVRDSGVKAFVHWRF